jgi:hypothetical protein
MTPNLKTGAIIGGFALLAAIAIAGWTRKPAPEPAYAAAAPYAQPAFYNSPAGGQPAEIDANRPSPVVAPANPSGVVAANNPCAEPVRYSTNERGVHMVDRTADRGVTSTRSNYVARPVRRKRSTGKSVAIVAGSAGAGAAIGALAGGGKGAGIGALSGGAAGFIYDRLTHNK